MNSQLSSTKRPRWRNLLWLGLLFVCLLWPLHHFVSRYYQQTVFLKNQQTLDLYVANVQGTLGRYEVLPQILGNLPSLKQALLKADDATAIAQANRTLERIQQETGADVIYLMDRNGFTWAASNWNTARPFSGNNFAFRPYFREAIQGRQGQFFGVGNISFKRGYYFGNAVYDGDKMIGVLVVKVDISNTETLWGKTPEQLVVTDDNGVIILTSNDKWRFTATHELNDVERNRIAAYQPYPTLAPKLWNINSKDWLVQTQELPKVGWKVSIYTPISQVEAPVRSAMAIVTITLLAVLLWLGILMQRRRHYLDRIALDAQAKHELEQNVLHRTQDLEALNAVLKKEVLKREQAQQELVKAQDELVQASKLTALGVMSASISHELNQPLAAIRNYADNSKIFLAHQRYSDVESNLGLISQLTERMASIIAHLRAFARRDRKASEHVALQSALDDSLALIAKRRQEMHVSLVRDIPDATLWVEAGETRLRQVLSNVLSNALDALSEKSAPRRIFISSKVTDEWISLIIRDNGNGFTQEALAQAREPFFTTKTSARGLGLGLAICDAVIRGLGGELIFSNHKEGGAIVEVRLRAIQANSMSHSTEDIFL